MPEKKNLEELLRHTMWLHSKGLQPEQVIVDAIVTDSRKATANGLFVALSGEHYDGHSFVDSAIQAGCTAIVIEDGRIDTSGHELQGVTVITVEDTRLALGELAAAFYGHPENQLNFIGITGTNGKTTTTYLLEKVLEKQKEKVGVIGTINYRYRGADGEKIEMPAPFTTPDPLILQEILRRMVEAGVGTVLMEVSSHALVQRRIGSIKYDIAVFTNLSHDHLDYHHSMEEYFQAKTILFMNHLKEKGKAVITYRANDERQNHWPLALTKLLEEHDVSYISCGYLEKCDIRPLHIEVEIDRTELELLTPQGTYSLVSPLVGRFNADNIMTTMAVVEAMMFDMQDAVSALSTAKGAPGRLERIMLHEGGKNRTIAFVDYAHTPDALLGVLTTLKGLPHERLVCVFGCGGDRDRAKRPEMGKIAGQLADIAIVTDDNPRSEESDAIIDSILEGVQQTTKIMRAPEWLVSGETGTGCVVVPDRREAIHRAVKCANKNDVVVIAGKGHEKYQLTRLGKRFFDDALEVREALFSWDGASVAEALGLTGIGYDGGGYYEGITTDSRNIKHGQVFVALQGENFDGHDYIEQAVKSGAAALIISSRTELDGRLNLPVYRVNNTLEALGDLAAYRRRRAASLGKLLVVGITGSTGKTTVKEMVAAICEKNWPDTPYAPCGRVLKTSGNFNNLIGLPLSLLPLQLKHEVAILEMGMNMPGEISRLTRIAGPDISCILNVHGAHLEGLGSVEGVASEKEELFRNTRSDGTLIVNLDDCHIRTAAAKYDQRKVTWTANDNEPVDADIRVSDAVCRDDGFISFTLHIGANRYPVKLNVPGMHNVANSVAAAAIAHAAGIDAEIIVAGLESFTAADKRLQVVSAAGGYSILNDTYNANPASMAAGLAALSSMAGNKKIAVLGDMLELGKSSIEAHRQLGEIAAKYQISCLLLVGSFAKYVATGAVNAGMARDKIMIFPDKDDIPSWIKKLEAKGLLPKDTWMLVKASRGMHLETVVESLVTK